MSALSTTIQSGTYKSLLHADMNSIAAVPEPSTILLMAAGLAGAGFYRCKTRRTR